MSDKLSNMLLCHNNTSWCVTLDFVVRRMCNVSKQSVTMLHQCYSIVQQYVYGFRGYAMLSDNITWMSTQCQIDMYMRNNVQLCATVSNIILQSTTSIQPSYDVTTLLRWCASGDNTITLLHNTCLVLYTKNQWYRLMYNDISPSTNNVQWCACRLPSEWWCVMIVTTLNNDV